jgi:hypothetical protein
MGMAVHAAHLDGVVEVETTSGGLGMQSLRKQADQLRAGTYLEVGFRSRVGPTQKKGGHMDLRTTRTAKHGIPADLNPEVLQVRGGNERRQGIPEHTPGFVFWNHSMLVEQRFLVGCSLPLAGGGPALKFDQGGKDLTLNVRKTTQPKNFGWKNTWILVCMLS